MEAEPNRLDIPLLFTRLLHEALFAANAFTCYNEVSPYNALFGRQPAMPCSGPRAAGGNIRSFSLTDNTQVAKTNRVSRTKTTITGQHYNDEGDLVDYHRPTTAKDDWGGWNGPSPVVRNDPEWGRVIIRVALIAREIGSDITALRTALTLVAGLSAGRPALICFGYVPTKKGTLRMTTACRLSPE
eukprot:1847364-Pyramimonas_sp.AAC.1